MANTLPSGVQSPSEQLLGHTESPAILPAPDLATVMHGQSVAAARLRNQIERIGPHFRRVLISGEPGSDREGIARALRLCSPARSGPFIVCDIADLEETGHLWTQEPSAGRVALRRVLGRAAGGMFWVDDVASLSPAAQTLLLRLPEESSAMNAVRVLVAVGSTANLRLRADAGTFLPELRLALAHIEIPVPPLRDRAEDLAELTRHAVHAIAQAYALPIEAIEGDLVARVERHAWIGNEAELTNVLRVAVLGCHDGVLRAEHLPVLDARTALPLSSLARPKEPELLQDVINEHILRTLAACNGNKLRAADRLGISRSTLYRMLDARAAPEAAA